MRDQFFIEEPKHITYRPQNDLPASSIELNGHIIGNEEKNSEPEEDTRQTSSQDSPWSNATKPTATTRRDQTPQERVAQALRDIEKLGQDQSQHDFSGNIVDPQQVPTPAQFNRPAQNASKKNSFMPVFFLLVAVAVVLIGPLSSLVSSFLDSINDDQYGNSSVAGGAGDDFGFNSYYTSTDFIQTDPEDPEIVESFAKRFELAIADEAEMRTLIDFDGYWTTDLLRDVEDSSMFKQYDFGVLTETLERENPYKMLRIETVVFAMASGLLDPEVDSDYLSQFLLAFSRYGNLPGQELKGGELLVSKKLLDGVKKSEYKVLLDEYFVEIPYEDTQLGSLADAPDSDSEQNRELRALLLWDMLIEQGFDSYEN